ncbi:AraC family transcriptional regulator [Azospirillum picis]|uniref:AraC-like DNA-binding protein n=1 Tax=Azospirillum picis TaxID=488438 RepID=A0ABU0MRQ4_9PROT|nr:AraC family transcriptional regulator [Azospirillum picis]MBP2302222.1 AraC-like DNA-binding protein [Azospirillum picis]MDQ0535801.1 AraC-like DNA-binding protein [Azospirillum picis]
MSAFPVLGFPVSGSPASGFQADPFSDVLSLLQVRSVRCSRLEARGPWALRFPERSRLKLVAVLRGNCWLLLPDRPPHRLRAGDLFLLTNTPYVVASDPAVPARDGMEFYREGGEGTVRLGSEEGGGGGEDGGTVMLGGGLVFEEDGARLVVEALPPVMCVSADHPAAAVLRNSLDLLDREMERPEIGAAMVAQGLAAIIVVQMLRAYVAENGRDCAGWVSALTDPRIARALTAMHREIARGWTVGALAAEAGMSRSAFASHFRRLAGVAPLDYLRRLRMERARLALRHGRVPVGELAAGLGYASESAFGHAYKRVFGRSPRHDRAVDA